MGSKESDKRFWQSWGDSWTDESPGFDYGQAWRKHFTSFLGVAPEEHWVFKGRRFKPWTSGKLGPPGLFNPIVAMVLSRGGGLLSLYVLHLLAEKPRYGNDIMKEIELRTRGGWGPNPGAVYPLLTSMEERGLVEGKWEDPEKRTRRIYRLTPAGKDELERLKEVMRPKLEDAIQILRHLNADLDLDVEGGGYA
ncbi:MAG: helix-turn-helix transcriptional regulator [Anaerolineales bacterium]